jgi:dihydropteroate synthase
MSYEHNYTITCRERVLDFADGPKIMGILNTTPDSFYDGGSFHGYKGAIDLERAFNHALRMIEAGASIIDIGGESSRPGAAKISDEEEIARTLPLIDLLHRKTDILISIDSYKAVVVSQRYFRIHLRLCSSLCMPPLQGCGNFNAHTGQA